MPRERTYTLGYHLIYSDGKYTRKAYSNFDILKIKILRLLKIINNEEQYSEYCPFCKIGTITWGDVAFRDNIDSAGEWTDTVGRECDCDKCGGIILGNAKPIANSHMSEKEILEINLFWDWYLNRESNHREEK
jgi:hypothetical protein